MNYVYCKECERNIHRDSLELTSVEGVTLGLCPLCLTALTAVSNLELTSDQCAYTIHCLQKQEAKLKHALNQVYATITKLEVLRELAKEKENK